ncbi:terpene synthase family protein [Kitasatospora purpeofusca]|uniref:terpene synthase family protein n=1 Tax=Kitasatospora purpeofusca TaxID=67352 RepID=UPI0036AED028
MTVMSVHAGLCEWAAALRPSYARDVTLVAALTTAFAAPWLPARAIALGARAGIWMTAVDDWVDAGPAGSARKIASLEHYRHVAAGADPDAGDPLAVALAGIAQDIDGQRWGSAVGPLWRQACQDTMVGMRFEHESALALEAGLPAPTLDTYLLHAARSSGVSVTVIPLWAAMDDADLPRCLPALTEAMQHASAAVRLANDLTGARRERLEGGVNALAIGVSAEQVSARITEEVARFEQNCAPLTAESYGPALALDRFMRLLLRMYQHRDPGEPEPL